ncbi:MAG TPA: dTDP-4-dehydrorhamnose reductase [Terracidiphilus sp.]|jgi:dTDP-4-dehydrorhamnose reductase|nr:dTDP-4-dehydrorhamnose reductase [Terracidiphilus sp.]
MSPAKVLILGSNGQVGLELQRSFHGFGEIVTADRSIVDLTRPDSIRDFVRHTQPGIILNAAAYTAVDKAESEPDLAYAINAEAPRVLAEEAAQLGAIFVHYSTDYIFNGQKESAWLEEDPPEPINIYGRSKLHGEQAIQAACRRFLIFRTSWVYGPHGRNFLLTMLRLGRERDELSIVDDQMGAPTSSVEIANATRAVLDSVHATQSGEQWPGVYHMSCAGSTSWCGFSRSIFQRAGELLQGRSPIVHPIPSTQYPTPAKRPANSVLSNEKLRQVFNVQLKPWESALDSVMKTLLADAEPSAKHTIGQ